MLGAEAVRLLAVEILRPQASVESGTGFPTRAGHRVYDSRAVAIEDLPASASYTPVLSLFTSEGGFKLRGAVASADDTEADCVLDIIGELAVIPTDASSGDAEAAAATDPTARLELVAMMAQVRWLLTRSDAGFLWRKIVKQVREVEYETFAVPNLGMRWQSVLMRMHCDIADDEFNEVGGILPEPINTVFQALPAGSYAKTKLAQLADAFAGNPVTPLTTIHGLTVPEGAGFGPDFS